MSRLIAIDIDDLGLPAPSAEVDQERKVAVFDLLEDNAFSIPRAAEFPGPYRLALGVREGRMVFGVATEGGEKVAEFHLSMGPFRQVTKDYFQICESYFDAVKRLPPSQIEAIDMARRGIHNEGARVLQERQDGKADVDTATARRLFTLICVLHWG